MGRDRSRAIEVGDPRADRPSERGVRLRRFDLGDRDQVGDRQDRCGHGAIAEAIEASGFVALPVTVAHAATVALLPPHHTDPFDRLLIAQALAEPLRLLSADAALHPYGDIVIAA